MRHCLPLGDLATPGPGSSNLEKLQAGSRRESGPKECRSPLEPNPLGPGGGRGWYRIGLCFYHQSPSEEGGQIVLFIGLAQLGKGLSWESWASHSFRVDKDRDQRKLL